jgi:hypothetical protein
MPDQSAAASADARMTAEREELKFLIEPRAVVRFCQVVGTHLPHHRFTGAGANPLPAPRHFVTTIYFDTPSRHQYRAAIGDSEHNLKMRAKEYYDIHPSLAELATDPSQIVKYQSVLWLELKFREGTHTGKQRIGIPKKDVPGFFSHGAITREMVELQRPLYGEQGDHVLREIAAYCGRYPEPFGADCLVNYRRMPWQDVEGQLRVTLDTGLEFYAPRSDLWEREHALVREALGSPVARQPKAVLELKTLGALPAWLEDLLALVQAERARFSKFEEASHAVHGSRGLG